MNKLNVLVAGSTGYIGVQLINLLCKHKYNILISHIFYSYKFKDYDIMEIILVIIIINNTRSVKLLYKTHLDFNHSLYK